MLSKEIRNALYKIPGIHKLSWRLVDFNNYIFYSRWEKQHNVHEYWNKIKEERKSDRCFIIGNGPSICKDDLEKLANEDCFVSNKFCYGYNLITWRPKYYVVQDRYALTTEELNNIDASHCLFGSYVWRKNKINNERAWCIPTRRALSPTGIRFGNSIENDLVSAYTVTFTIIQIAYYLGYKEIYLLGIDHDFPLIHDDYGRVIFDNKKRHHFFEDSSIGMMNIEGATNAYYCAELFAKEHNIEIKNCTRGGKLEVFHREMLEEVLK